APGGAHGGAAATKAAFRERRGAAARAAEGSASTTHHRGGRRLQRNRQDSTGRADPGGRRRGAEHDAGGHGARVRRHVEDRRRRLRRDGEGSARSRSPGRDRGLSLPGDRAGRYDAAGGAGSVAGQGQLLRRGERQGLTTASTTMAMRKSSGTSLKIRYQRSERGLRPSRKSRSNVRHQR